MTVNDEGDSEGDDNRDHHPPGLEIIMRTVPDNQDTEVSKVPHISSGHFTRRASVARSPGYQTC